MMRIISVCALLSGYGALAAAQDPPLTVQPRWNAEQFLSGRTPLEFTLTRALHPEGERLAPVIGSVDVSALLEVRGTRARYQPVAARLPSGDSEIIAYIVDAEGAWIEAGRFPLHVRTRAGLDQGKLIPRAD